jgi:hypothetical protein
MYSSIYPQVIPLIRTQDEKIGTKDDEKIVGSYLRFNCVNSDSLLLDSTR